MKSFLVLLVVILMEECGALNEPWATANDSPLKVSSQEEDWHHGRRYLHVQCSCRSCVEEIMVIALTSNWRYGASDGDFQLELTAYGQSKSVMLPDLPGDDFMPNKVDLFTIEVDSYGFGRCVKPGDIDKVALKAATSDGWNIESIITLQCLENNSECFVLTLDSNVFRWLDGDDKPEYRYFELELSNPMKKDYCINELAIIAVTSNLQYAGSDDTQKVELKIKGETREIPLPDLRGDDFLREKGDVWRLSFTKHFGIGSGECVTVEDIEGIAILSGSDDGWNIESIITLVCRDRDSCQLATIDMNVERWIDGDDEEHYKRFDLTII